MAIIAIQDEAHWHRLRQGNIGASEIAALFNCSPFVTQHSLWARLRGLLAGMEDNPILKHGRQMEPIIAERLEDTYQLGIKKSNEFHVHPTMPWRSCTLDYYALNYDSGEHGHGPQPTLLEIKHVSGPWVEGWSQSKAPEYIEFQAQEQLIVVNAARVALGYTPFRTVLIGAMFGGNPEDLRLYPRQEIPHIADAIARQSQIFWEECILGDREPSLDSPKDIEHIRAMFKARGLEEEVLDLSEQTERLAEYVKEWRSAKAAEKYHADRKSLMQSRLMRACMIIDAEDVTGHMIGRTHTHDITLRKGTQVRGDKVIDTLGFDVRDRR